ncbi:MAG: ComEC/Rec2 family competence protein [Ignavibacteria bacterium]|nr:ComEC/Rec2 family competence protein [Ignavibacteria bacterium]
MTDQPRIIFTRYPAFRLLCGMALGILFHSTATWNIPGFIILFSCLSLLSAGFYYRKKLVLSFWVASFALGIWVGNSAQQVQIPQSIVSEIPTTISGKITSVLRQDSLNFRCIIDGSVDAQQLPVISSSRVILTVNLLSDRENFLKVGSIIYAAGTLRTPQTPTLPMEFDERQYCKSQDVQFLMKAKASDVAIVEKAGGFPALVAEIVAALEQRIQILYSNESGAIVSALLLGNQTKISKETRKIYSLSGTAHILSVSGSHVGIIAAIIFVFLGFVRSRWLKFLIFTLAISAFIIVSGMQPAAMRAGLMAILAMLGFTLQRRVFALNILCLSIVILLLCQPILIYSSGFQMSVASVFGITIFYAPFHATFLSHLTNKSSVTEFIASSLALTFAASVTVSPLVAYYFSTFSVVSPCTNVLIVPLMSLAMIFGMASVLLLPVNVGIATTYSAATAWCISTSESINQWSVNYRGLGFNLPNLQ